MDLQRTTVLLFILALPALLQGCEPRPTEPAKTPLPGTDEVMDRILEHCRKNIGTPQIRQITNRVWVATGYDLANTVILKAGEGYVVVDPGMNAARAGAVRQDFFKRHKPGPVRAIVYTHSHIDHVGGATAWAGGETCIWATANFLPHFFKQYSGFRQIETLRGSRQFGQDVPAGVLPCHGIGRRIDMVASAKNGVILPDRSFTGKKVLKFDDLTLELHEAHGETHDQLFVWVPAYSVLIAGDNIYRTFPNLYTIRGSSPRPVDAWIQSLDHMRRFRAKHLVGNHTLPLSGAAEVARVLRDYRDTIQWVRDEVVRGANAGLTPDRLAESIRLPDHLRGPWTEEFYGQVDWSARAIFSNRLGWFSGDAADLYPVPAGDAARREVAMMGGDAKVRDAAARTLEEGDQRWALHLLQKLRHSREGKPETMGPGTGDPLEARALEEAGRATLNLNGRAWLMQAASEIRQGRRPAIQPVLPEKFVASIPLSVVFENMAYLLKADEAMDLHRTISFEFTDLKTTWFLTIRRGILQVTLDTPLPDSPPPAATLMVHSLEFKKLLFGARNPVQALAGGDLKIRGSWLDFIGFLRHFKLQP